MEEIIGVEEEVSPEIEYIPSAIYDKKLTKYEKVQNNIHIIVSILGSGSVTVKGGEIEFIRTVDDEIFRGQIQQILVTEIKRLVK